MVIADLSGDDFSLEGSVNNEEMEEEGRMELGQNGGGIPGNLISNMLVEQRKFYMEMMDMKDKRKRCREEDDEEVEKPVLIDVKNHRLLDDAKTVFDWKARSLRPFNGADQKVYWENMPVKYKPVLEDVDISHLTKMPVNPSVVAKAHDRGEETTAKQWLSTNYSVRSNDCKMRASDKGLAGSFFYDFQDSKGVWEVVDGVFNYMHVLSVIKPEDYSARLLLYVLHQCRFFSHPNITAKGQKELVMLLFDQVV